MNTWFIAGGVCAVAGVVMCGVLLARKYATLRMLDPDTSRTMREKKLRNRIMEDRMQRTVQVHVARVIHAFLIPWRILRDAFRRAAGKLIAIERRYHREHARDAQISSEELHAMLTEAERAIREERFQVAEERLVELVSAAPKFAQAYEALSRVYSAKKEWKEAVESLVCYVKLSPKDSEGRFLLGALYEETREFEKALVEYEAALEKAPHNPKYLDAYISLAIQLDKPSEALRALKVLREVNPENAKIADFAEALEGAIPVKGEETVGTRPRGRKKKEE